MIHLEGYGENPAVSLVEKNQIKNQKDPRLKDLTEEIYKKEFHQGKMKSIAGKLSGHKVSEVKPALVQEFLKKKIAERFYDLVEPVICRCGTENFVKILQDQWFLKYSDQKWKDRVREAIKTMKFFPEESRNWFLEIVDWLEDKACTRKSGLGTKLPWDPEWLVETLSDSTIYMAFYTISHLLKLYLGGLINPKDLSKEVFDFIFLGIIPKNKDKNFKIWEKMREQFLYWYPVDFRNSAKELIPNHLTFYIFHHVALFNPNLWPRAIGTNGMITIEGQKMSKSKGVFITLKNAID